MRFKFFFKVQIYDLNLQLSFSLIKKNFKCEPQIGQTVSILEGVSQNLTFEWLTFGTTGESGMPLEVAINGKKWQKLGK